MPAANPKLRLKNGFDEGKTMWGTFMMLSTAWTARVVAAVGWDFVIVDCEHGNIGDSDMHDSVNAVASCGVSPIVRIRGPDPTLIKRALDTGAHGIMVPMINTAAEAELVVKASKFPPLGFRGQGSPFSAWGLGLATPQYLEQANSSLLTIVQIETLEGLKNLDAICAVEGVDAIFVGPNDLALCMLGYAPAKYTEQHYLDAITQIKLAAKKAGKPVGILCPDGPKGKQAATHWPASGPSGIQSKGGEGFEMIAVGGDVKAIQLWMGAALAAAKE